LKETVQYSSILNKLTIIEARYGPRANIWDDVAVEVKNDMIDATQILQKLVDDNNELHLNTDKKANVMNSIMGDPKLPTKPRKLGIRYK